LGGLKAESDKLRDIRREKHENDGGAPWQMEHVLGQAIKTKSLIEKRNNLRNNKWYRNQQRNTNETVTRRHCTITHMNENDTYETKSACKRCTIYTVYTAQKPDKLHHATSAAYEVKLVMQNKREMSGHGDCQTYYAVLLRIR